MILAIGVILTMKSRFAQAHLFLAAIAIFWDKLRNRKDSGDETSAYRALCTALAATVGTGNIAGVAGAIAIGGPGVVFWMWVSGILGMIIKFAEVTLAVHFRRKDDNAQYLGGPMYMISEGLPEKMKFLSVIYCVLGLAATFGVGNSTQINAVVEGGKSIMRHIGVPFELYHLILMGVTLSVLITLAFRNGTRGIGHLAEKLVPVATILYIILGMLVLILRMDRIPAAIFMIFKSAFMPRAVTGGVISSAFLTLRVGISRGIFTNEAGMGTACIAHASANVENAVSQGLMGMIEVFWDTIVLCTLTALVILCSGVQVTYGSDPGILLTMDAFSLVLGEWSRIILTLLVCIFAFATVLGWGFYGLRFYEYLFGSKTQTVFIILEAIVCFASVLGNTSMIWILAEIFNGLMAIPNMIALILLMPVFILEIKAYKKAYR